MLYRRAVCWFMPSVQVYHEMTIEDARGYQTEFTIDRSVAAGQSAERGSRFLLSRKVNYSFTTRPERLLRDAPGASCLFVFDHAVRSAGRTERVCRCAGSTTAHRPSGRLPAERNRDAG